MLKKKKPSNKTLSSEEALAETPKKGTYREPNSKKLSSEVSLQKSHKLVHLKEFNSFDLIDDDESGWEGPSGGVINIENLTNYQLLESFKDAVCDRNYNPSSEDYNKSGFTYDQLEEEILKRMNND